jgi:hypothetical protein
MVARWGLFFALSTIVAGCSRGSSGGIVRVSSAANTGSSAEARITATPNPVPIESGLGKTTIAWNTGDGGAGQIYVSRDGGAEQLVTQGAEGADDVNWIEAGPTYEFRLYAGLARTKLLTSVTVKGVRSNPQGR